MQKVTLGGDRLGSGKKQKIELHGYERSTHDIGYVFRTTMSAGTLVPFLKEIALPGDTFDINLHCDIKTHPTVGPLFGTYKVQLDVFQCPIRLYNALLMINATQIGMRIKDVFLPFLALRAPSTAGIPIEDIKDIDNSQVNPSSILAYLGIRGAGWNDYTTAPPIAAVYRRFNALGLLGYWDIYKNYYANKQEEIGAVIHTTPVDISQEVATIEINNTILPQDIMGTPIAMAQGSTIDLDRIGLTPQPANQIVFWMGPTLQDAQAYLLSDIATMTSTIGTTDTYTYLGLQGGVIVFFWYYSNSGAIPATKIDITTFPLTNLDDARMEILTSGPAQVQVGAGNIDYAPYSLPFAENLDGTIRSIKYSQEGLGLKCYQSDVLNNWLNTEWIDGTNGIAEITAVDTSAGSFKIDALLLAKKVYDMYNRILVSDGTYKAWVETVYDTEMFTMPLIPIYHGGLIKEVVFEEVISNAEATNPEQGTQPLGTLAGRGRMGHKHKGGQLTIRVTEPSILLGIVSLTPRIDQSQGNDWDVTLETMDDLHKPQLDQIGFQELITTRMAWWDADWNGPVGVWETKSAGKQPAWTEYMTNINRVRGNFAIKGNESFMVLLRNYEPEFTGTKVTIKDLTTYIDPRKYNQIFAATSLDSQNFWTQIGVDMTVRRKISAKIMPNL